MRFYGRLQDVLDVGRFERTVEAFCYSRVCNLFQTVSKFRQLVGQTRDGKSRGIQLVLEVASRTFYVRDAPCAYRATP